MGDLCINFCKFALETAEAPKIFFQRSQTQYFATDAYYSIIKNKSAVADRLYRYRSEIIRGKFMTRYPIRISTRLDLISYKALKKLSDETNQSLATVSRILLVNGLKQGIPGRQTI